MVQATSKLQILICAEQVVMLSSFDKIDDVWEIHSNVILWMLLYFIHMDEHSSFIARSAVSLE